MLRMFGACAVTALAAWAVTASGGGAAGGAAHGVLFVPSCPHASFGADGNMGPLFCVIDDPAALRYFGAMGRRTLAVGPSASPTQVAAALTADRQKAVTGPILCSIFRLAAWRNHWRFAVSPANDAGIGWCQTPSFGKVGS